MPYLRKCMGLLLTGLLLLGQLWAELPLGERIRTILADPALDMAAKLAAVSELVDLEAASPQPQRAQTLDRGGDTPTAPPRIKTNCPEEGVQTPFDTFVVEVLARSVGGKVTSVSINGISQPLPVGSTVGLIEEVSLDMGENALDIVVSDNSGQSTVLKRTITRIERPSRRPSNRASLVVLPLDQDSGALASSLAQFVLETQRYRLVEREQLDAILKEQALAGSLFADKNQSIRIGKLLSARYSLAGEVRMGQDVEIVTRMIDNESGEVLAIVDAYSPDTDRANLRYSMRHLAGRLREVLPWFKTTPLMQRDGRLVLARPRSVDPVAGQDFLLVVQEEDIIDESTGLVLLPGQETIVGKARLEEVSRGGLICTLEAPIEIDLKELQAISR